MDKSPFDNSGNGPLRVPGFNGNSWWARHYNYGMQAGRPYFEEKEPRLWLQSPSITVRELHIIQTIARITEEEAWHLHVSDPEFQNRWRKEAVSWIQDAEIEREDARMGSPSLPFMDDSTWDWCLAELTDKAEDFWCSGTTLLLNCAAGICRAESVLLKDIRTVLVPMLSSVMDEKKYDRRWGEGAHHRLVRPEIYPLIHGQTPALSQGGFVPLDQPVEIHGRDLCPEKSIQNHLEVPSEQTDSPSDEHNTDFRRVNKNHYYCKHVCFFSDEYDKFKINDGQWLPCDLTFCSEDTKKLSLVSYINNLHPCHKELYQVIEQLASFALESWNQVVVKCDREGRFMNRFPLRVKTYGVEWTDLLDPASPRKLADSFPNYSSWEEAERLRHHATICQHYPALFASDMDFDDFWDRYEDQWQSRFDANVDDECWKHPRPGLSFTYSEWKQGLTAKAIIPRLLKNKKFVATADNGDEPLPPQFKVVPDENHTFYTISLADECASRGLQLYVEISSVELEPSKTPGDSRCGSCSSHWQSRYDEHVIATTMFSFSMCNVQGGRLHFEQWSRTDPESFGYDNFDLKAVPEGLKEIFGCPYELGPQEDWDGYNDYCPAPCTDQKLGSVAIREGETITWPKQFECKEQGWQLIDDTKPEHHRFIKLMLVDPNYRLCSTRNVRAQQPDWWRQAAIEAADLGRTGLPAEIIEMIHGYLRDEDAPSYKIRHKT